ncbi:MAG TPA: hypothetical protein VGP82_14960, partial [Ktedonobacterales bacterium]|nr:hypothetical protein [Ktedonobacterales bacterium]
QGQDFIDALRQLILAAQATGEVAAGDPDQLVAAAFAYLDGLTRMALYGAERLKLHFPDAVLLLRIFRPQAGQS